MKKQIRENVFETNSSSMHSIAINKNNNGDYIVKDIRTYLNEYNKIPIFAIELDFG